MRLLLLNTIKLIIIVVLISFCNISSALNYTKNNFTILNKLKNLESGTEGRLGIFAVNTENEHVIKYRANEIFPTGCTSKTIGVAAVLKKCMINPSILSKRIKYTKEELAEWSPVTKKYVLDGMTVQELCAASISLSDNTAMNLLLKLIGGIQGMNDFARYIGDYSFRQDNDWPAEAFSGGAGNLKDSSTPKAMVESFRKLTLGKVLDRPQRDLFTTWLINTQTGSARIRSGIPEGWIVGDKTGSGAYGSTNDLAIVWPPKHAPVLIGIYYTSDNSKATRREDVLCTATRFLIEEFVKKDKKLQTRSL